MAKVSFTKLGLTKNQKVNTMTWGDQVIEIKQYLPVDEKLTLIAKVINQSHDANNYSNPVKVEMFTVLEVLYAYTNINFTDKQKEDFIKLYDTVISSGFWAAVLAAIPTKEFEILKKGIVDCTVAVYAYENSVLGILDSIKSDYSNLDLDALDIQEKLADPENMSLLRDVLDKLG